jgi:hypothetical protein
MKIANKYLPYLIPWPLLMSKDEELVKMDLIKPE